jgi:hypothetical protein
LGESHEDGSFTAHKAVMRGGKGGDECTKAVLAVMVGVSEMIEMEVEWNKNWKGYEGR